LDTQLDVRVACNVDARSLAEYTIARRVTIARRIVCRSIGHEQIETRHDASDRSSQDIHEADATFVAKVGANPTQIVICDITVLKVELQRLADARR
jgi:hypothetical protein